jgi:hypothetical protein
MVKASLGKNQNPISKITKAKRAGGVAQAVECLYQAQALSSNPNTDPSKKNTVIHF